MDRLYKCAKKGVFSVSFSIKIVETEDNFCQNLGKNRYFGSKSVGKNLFSGSRRYWGSIRYVNLHMGSILYVTSKKGVCPISYILKKGGLSV